jgi:hypothetical protein
VFTPNNVEEALGTISSTDLRLFAEHAVRRFQAGVTHDLELLSALQRYPVPIEEFIESPGYLGMAGQVYPVVMDALIELNNPVIEGLPHRYRLGSSYTEAVLTGAIGTGKTTIALLTMAYQVYVLSCLRDPQRVYGLDRASELLFVFQSVNERLAKQVDFERFRALVSESPYFREYFPYNRDVKSELRFPNRVIVRPVSGLETATLGQNVFGGCFPAEQEFLLANGSVASMGERVGQWITVMTRKINGVVGVSLPTRVVCTGQKSLVRLEFDNGESIVCTPDQKFQSIEEEWINASDATGRDFRITSMPTVPIRGDLPYPTPPGRPQHDGHSVQETVSRRAPLWSEDDRAATDQERRRGHGAGRMRNLSAAPSRDYGETLTFSRYDTRRVPPAVSGCDVEDHGSAACPLPEGTCQHLKATTGPSIQGEPSAWDCKSCSACLESDEREILGPRGAAQARGADLFGLGEAGFRPKDRTPGEITTEDVLLRVAEWPCAAPVEAGGRGSLLAGCAGIHMELRAGERPVLVSGSGEGLHARLLDRRAQWVPGMQDRVHDEQGAIGSVPDQGGCDARTSLSAHGRRYEDPPHRQGTSVVRSQFETEGHDLFRTAPRQVGRVRCIGVRIICETPQPVYDVENAGPSHIFFAALGSGFIEAKNCLDEINFMAQVDRSKRSADGDRFDQAVALYNSISRRRKSRFMKAGHLPGMLCLVSSKRYPGQFTDQKLDEAAREERRRGSSPIFVFDKTTWDVKPAGTFSGATFPVFAGDETRSPRVLTGEDATAIDQSLIVDVPVEYRPDFEMDLVSALRDIAGRSTQASHPFLMNTEAVAACFGRRRSIFSRADVDFVETDLALHTRNIKDPQHPRWIHIDLALTGDSAGFAIGHVPRFTNIKRGNEIERLPVVVIDGTLEIRPPKGGEIQIWKVRDLIYLLSDAGMNIRWVSFDGFQSADSIQILRQKGLMTGIRSMDRSPKGYELLKTALYDGRVEVPEDPKLLAELRMLERDTRTGKIDHPTHGSKDVADALAGVVSEITLRREVWIAHQNTVPQLPASVRAVVEANRSPSEGIGIAGS